MLCKASTSKAATKPLPATASRWPARKRDKLGGSVAAGRTSGAKTLASNKKPKMKIVIEVTLAQNTLMSEIGNECRTNTSSRSGKNISHSKIVTMPKATNEYRT